jgi:hypothetical protein
MVNFKDNFESVIKKWKKISASVMGVGQRILGHNEEFWKITFVNRMALNLP